MKTYEIFFSPTGGTKRVADCVAAALSEAPVTVDLTVRAPASLCLTEEDLAILAVPSYGGRVPALSGNRPYKKAGGAGLVPKPIAACTACGVCARECPARAIDPQNPKKVDGKACISCMRCISVCPQHARKANGLMLALVGAALKKPCAGRKENELFV